MSSKSTTASSARSQRSRTLKTVWQQIASGGVPLSRIPCKTPTQSNALPARPRLSATLTKVVLLGRTLGGERQGWAGSASGADNAYGGIQLSYRLIITVQGMYATIATHSYIGMNNRNAGTIKGNRSCVSVTYHIPSIIRLDKFAGHKSPPIITVPSSIDNTFATEAVLLFIVIPRLRVGMNRVSPPRSPCQLPAEAQPLVEAVKLARTLESRCCSKNESTQMLNTV